MLRKTRLLLALVMLLGLYVFPLDAAPDVWCRDCEPQYNACTAACEAGDPENINNCMNGCSIEMTLCFQRCEDEG